MEQKDGVIRLQGQIRKSFFQDGLTEIMLGIFLLACAALWDSDAEGTGLMVIIGIFVLAPLLKAAKNKYVYPRLGYADFGKEEEQQEAKGILRFAVFAVVFLAVGYFGVTWFLGAESGRDFWYFRFLPVVIGLLLAIGPAAIAGKNNLPRWYLFSIFFVTVGVIISIADFDSFSQIMATQLAVSGIVPLIVGVLLFLLFLRKYPVEAEDGEVQS
jgi:MFS family permease